jgi:MAternally-affected-uncoordination protein
MFRYSGEVGKEAEHAEAEGKKLEELHRRIEEAQATPYHAPLLQVCPLLVFSGS